MIKQFIPQEVCLKCLGCCRFKEEDSVWAPCLLDEEIQGFLDKKIQLLPNPKAEGFICAFFDSQTNKCRIYASRPFECQLYPFLINLRGGKVVLTVDLNCQYLKEKLGSQEFKEYVEILSAFLNSPDQIKTLKNNPQIIQAYGEVAEIIELNI